MAAPQEGESQDYRVDETTRLLHKNLASTNGEHDIENGNVRTPSKSTWKLVYWEFLLLLRSSIPVILAYTLQNSLQTISVVIVGRGSPDDLATAAFSYMFAMATAWLIALGGTTALDTLASASFTGSEDRLDLGILLQRGVIVLSLFYAPIAVLWFFSEPVFLALGQDPQVSRDSARFLRALIPGGLGYIYFEAMKKYLQAQGNLHSTIIRAQLTYLRDHAPWDLCALVNFAIECRPQLPVCLHFQGWSSRSSGCDGYFVLAIVSAASSLLLLHTRVRMLGRLVKKMLAKYAGIRAACAFGHYSCRH